MADFKFEIPSDFLDQLGKLANVERLAPKMIDEALPTLEASFKRNMQSVMKNPTGELMDSIKIFKTREVKGGGFFGYVTATGAAKGKKYKRQLKGARTREEGYRNYQKILALEYGTSKQVPTPFIQRAVSGCETEVLDKMQEAFNREVEK